MPVVLDVGCGPASRVLPTYFAEWKRTRLDIDPHCEPDIVLDARNLATLEPLAYDAVFCSHNLEHFHRHECLQVLTGMHHVLKPDGLAEIRVPDIDAVVKTMVQR